LQQPAILSSYIALTPQCPWHRARTRRIAALDAVNEI
jgi:hypothetical protein